MSGQVQAVNTTDQTEKAEGKQSLWRAVLVAMRPHQWVKNFFIFAPLLFGMKLADTSAIGNSFLAFSVFCLMASGLYIINDIVDREEDRSHPEKRLRPISSGALKIPVALAASVFLTVAAFLVAAMVSVNLFLIALLYFVLTLGYCLILKNLLLLDGITIAFGFVLRIVGGAVAIEVVPTHWLIVCAFLLALFLAFSKRRQELLMLSERAADHRQVLSQYTVPYLDQVNTILIAAAIVCYALYTVAPETVARFNTDYLIYGTVFVIYGMLRYMALSRDSSYGGNPSKIFLHDRPLLLTVVGWGVYNAAVIYHFDIFKVLFG